MRLYYSTTTKPADSPENEGLDIENAVTFLRTLSKKLGFEFLAEDTSTMSAGDIRDVYIEAMSPAIVKGSKGYNIRQVFGSRRLSGVDFGTKTPALLVHEKGSELVSDTYPHRIGQSIVTMRAFLEQLAQQVIDEAPS